MPGILAQTNELGVRNTLDAAFELLGSPVGILGVLGLVGFLIATVLLRNGWVLVVGVLLLVSTLSDGTREFFDNTLFSPLQQIRSAAQFIVVALIAVLILGTRSHARDAAARIAGGALVALFVFEIFYGLRLTLAGQFLKGGLAVVTYCLLFAAWPFGVSRVLSQPSNTERLIRIYALVAVPYVLLNVVQYRFAPNNTIVSDRFAGISGNPQHTGMMCAFMSLTFAWLLSRPRRNRWIIPAAAIGVGGTVLLLAWTGSRTAMLAAAVGLLIMFRRRAVTLVLVGGFVAMAGLLAAIIVGEGQEAFERLTSTDNTRADVWAGGLEEFARNPIFGTFGINTSIDLKVVESTPIQTLQLMGFVGFLFLLPVYLMIARSLLLLHRARTWSPERAPFCDYVSALWVMLVIMSIFEAVFLGIVTFFNLTFYFAGVLTSRLVSGGVVAEDELDDEAEEDVDLDDESYDPVMTGEPSPAT